MFTSFSTALSALSATAEGVDAVGNDLANLNTVGYKASEVSFHDLVAQSMAPGDSAEAGLGVSAATLFRSFTQGAVQASGGLLDAAISGDGFFVLHDPQGNLLLTRAGNFRLDKDGNLLSATGEHVQGWTAVNGVLNTTGAPGNITIPPVGLSAPVATTQLTTDMNLDAGAAAKATFSIPVQVVDSLGTQHVVTLTFTNGGAGSWSVSGSSADGTVKITGGDNLTFDTNGQLKTPDAKTAASVALTGLKNGAADLNINWNLYTPNGNATITQFAQASAVTNVTQDGATASQITGVRMQDGGQIIATYSNGQQQTIAQLALATVRNPDSLNDAGDNNFQLTADSAAPAVGLPETGGRGKILGGSLEASTVDVAKEFTNLIVFQRSYQANARVITTTDELTQETVNLIH